MLKDELKRIILENQERMPFGLFARRIETLRATRQIHAVVGLWRAGKTFFLYQIINELLASGVPREGILLVNFEDERLAGLSAERLGMVLDAYYELFPGRVRDEVHVFLDEVFFEVQDARDDAERRRIVTTYVDLVVYKDLVERNSVKNLAAMKALIRHFVTNATRKASLTRLAATLGAGPVSKNTILQYTSFLEDANVIYACPKFSYKLRQGNTPSKFYLADPSFKTVAGANFSADRGPFFENAVYVELRRRGFEVSFFEEAVECDFIAKSGTKVVGAYQVCVDPERAGDRELRGLRAALDAFGLDRGTIVTADEDREETLDGQSIRYIPLWRWLLDVWPRVSYPPPCADPTG